MSWSDGGETFPVKVDGVVRFRLAIGANVRGLTDDVPSEVVERARQRILAALNGSKEAVEAAILSELSNRVPGITFGFDDSPPNDAQEFP